jgi:uncharacterized protein (TIGR03067 family)
MKLASLLMVTVMFALTCVTNAGEDSEKDLVKMQGTWKHEGESLVTVIKAETMKSAEPGKEAVVVAKIKLNETKSPKWIDAELDGGAIWEGIYKFEGDKLIIAFGGEKKRPKEFNPKADDLQGYMVLKKK